MSSLPAGGALRRRIELRAEPRRIIAALEDDFHYFIVTFEHDGRCVTAASSRTLRAPWTVCPQAGALLQQFVGRPLTARPLHDIGDIDPKIQCTHQYDLALLAVAQALRGGSRQYEATIPDRVEGQTRATLLRDEQPCLDWHLDQTTVLSPPPYSGRDLRSMTAWALENLDDDALEALWVLRRAVMVSRGRSQTLSYDDTPLSRMPAMTGACFVYRPGPAELARRMCLPIDSAQRAEPLLADLDARLASQHT